MKRMSSRLAPFLIATMIALVVLMPAVDAAPSTVPFTVRGYIYDEDGAAVAGADVTVKNERTGQVIETNTSTEGYYKAILGGPPPTPGEPDYRIDDGDVVSIRATYQDLDASRTDTLPVAEAIAGTSPSYIWVNMTLEEGEANGADWLPMLGVGSVGVALIALVAVKRRRRDFDEDESEYIINTHIHFMKQNYWRGTKHW